MCFKIGGCFYKHSEKCLQETTIVPHGVIVSQSGVISCFFYFFVFFKRRMENLRDFTCCHYRFALTAHGFRVHHWLWLLLFFLIIISLSQTKHSHLSRRRFKHSASQCGTLWKKKTIQKATAFCKSQSVMKIIIVIKGSEKWLPVVIQALYITNWTLTPPVQMALY